LYNISHFPRIDRALHNVEWAAQFENAILEYLAENLSNHFPLQLKFCDVPKPK